MSDPYDEYDAYQLRNARITAWPEGDGDETDEPTLVIVDEETGAKVDVEISDEQMRNYFQYMHDEAVTEGE